MGKSNNNEKDAFDNAFDAVSLWIDTLRKFPGFAAWKRKSLNSTLSHGDPLFKYVEKPTEMFVFPPHVVKQHDAITAFLALHSTWQAMADTEFYFRRYPFQNLPISMDAHLRDTCESYFSRVYEFSERMKKCLNAIDDVVSPTIDTGAIVRRFGKEFREELKERNLIHHHSRFDEVTIDKVALMGLMAFADEKHGDRGWKIEHRRAYREASKEWAARAKRRSARVRDYLNAVSLIVSEQCSFLSDPVTVDPPK